MDKTILNLLFNYKGTITCREFRVGTVILFMLVGTHLSLLIDPMIIQAIAGSKGSVWLASNIYYSLITNSFTPNLVPVWFIVSYSSFILAVKRIGTLNNSRMIAVVSGIINYLFFASFAALIMLEIYRENLASEAVFIQVFTPALSYTVYTLFVLGCANLLYLCTRRKTEQSYFAYSKKRLDVSGYGIKIGNMLVISIGIGIITGIVIKLNDNFLLSPITQAIIGLCGLTILFFYIKYSIYRLKDANISILWLICAMAIYSIMFGLKIWINWNFQNNIVLCYNSVFAIVTSLFIAAQYVLFLLPTKKNEQQRE
jgi:hypothetical protein